MTYLSVTVLLLGNQNRLPFYNVQLVKKLTMTAAFNYQPATITLY
jgi:hypothetical protein